MRDIDAIRPVDPQKSDYAHGIDVGLAMANVAIKEQKTAQQWIPCSERLPEEGGYYLTTTMYQEVYCDYWNGDNFDRTEMVIAWMPLPEPWKGEQQ